MGHSLIGDCLYGGREFYGFKRQALHSAFLEFKEPDVFHDIMQGIF